jgi:hypothetical protein
MGRVRSADLAARAALVELDGSEGTAVPARLGDGLHPHALAPGGECVLGVSEAGERTLLATLDHRPGDLPVLGASAASTAAPPTSFAYTDGATWRDALAVSVRSLAACDVWASGWLALRAPSATATPAWELRVAVDGASAGPAVGWGSALANLQQVSNLQARLPLPGPGLWTVRLQLRVRLSGATVACSAGLLLAETRLP